MCLGVNISLTLISQPNVRPYASPITWRKAGVKHNNNEIFFNVIESIDAIVDKHGNAVMAEINGQIECDSRLSGG